MDDPTHDHKRAVVCDPPSSGFLGLGKRRLRPAKAFTDGGDGAVVCFPDAATELMAQRARATFHLARGFHAEFAEFECPLASKIGVPAASGSHEHMWFLI